jgi:LCP family protein required for cell wall assembly
MTDQQKPSGAVPPEFEHLLRPPTQPAASVTPTSPSTTPRHDRVSDTGLSDFSDLFRDPPPPPTPPRVPAATPPSPAATEVLPPSHAVPHAEQMAAPPPVRATPPTGPARPGSPGKPRKGGRAKRILIYVLVGLLAYITALVAYFALNVNKIDAMPVDQIPDTAGSNYLLVGSDGREELTREQQKELHTGSTEGQRTDSIMLLHVPLLGTPTLISLPRDSWVPIPGNADGKINSAYAIGGPPLLIQTVENTTGVHIDHYVEIGMLGISDIANSLGGVTLCPADNYNDKNSGLNVDKGCQTMDGPTSLAYVRMRYADPKGDLGRAERQQEFIKAVASKSASPLTFLNPFKMFSVDRAAASSLTVDEGTGLVADARMALAMGMISAGMGEQTTVPIESDSYWVGGQQAVKWDTPKALELFDSVGGG